MNVYFLVEGQAEFGVYPVWIDHLTRGKLRRNNDTMAVRYNEYYIFAAEGGKIIHSASEAAAREIALNPVFDYLVVIIDAEGDTVTTREEKVRNKVANVGLPTNCQLVVLVQNICFETWLCGHVPHYQTAKSIATNKNVMAFLDDYAVDELDPEMMPNNPRSRAQISHLTIGQYHFVYLHHMLRPIHRKPYNKGTASAIIDTEYLQQIIHRSHRTSHLRTFDAFIRFMEVVNEAI